jgi:hypothetical protein
MVPLESQIDWVLLLAVSSVSAQSADPFSTTVSGNCNPIYQQQSDVSTNIPTFDGTLSEGDESPSHADFRGFVGRKDAGDNSNEAVF